MNKQQNNSLILVWAPIHNETVEAMAQYTAGKKEVLEYIANNTGWNPSIAGGADLAKNLISMVNFHAAIMHQ